MLELPAPGTRVTVADLRDLTNRMLDAQLALLADCTDADVVFVPQDPAAEDTFAATPEEVNLAWTLGHLVVHVTASSEESAALAAELARGVEFHGRSRYETHWTTVKTVEQCRHLLEESRRMRLASLEMWPAEPHVENTYVRREGAPPTNCFGRFISGLYHDNSHMDQIAEVIRQAQAARNRG